MQGLFRFCREMHSPVFMDLQTFIHVCVLCKIYFREIVCGVFLTKNVFSLFDVFVLVSPCFQCCMSGINVLLCPI